MVREREIRITQGPGGAAIFFLLIETQSITGQKFSKCLKNGSDRLPKGNLRLQDETF